MQMQPAVTALYQFAASCHFARHQYLAVKDGQIVTSTQKGNQLQAVVSSCLALLKSCDLNTKPIIYESLRIIRQHLNDKCSGMFARLFYPEKVQKIKSEIAQIDAVLQDASPPTTEELFRLNFLAALPKKLSVKYAPNEAHQVEYQWRDGTRDVATVNEWKVIAWLSQAVYESDPVQSLRENQRWEKYFEIMSGAYQGDHMLIEDDAEHHRAQELQNCGAIIRGSSHYEKGRKIERWDEEGKPVYASELHPDLVAAEVHHYGLTGNHIRHILFNPVDMREQENESDKLIKAKTARQVDSLAAVNKLKVGEKMRHYVAFQFESSPDSEGNNLKDPLFYTHRLTGFITYRLRKLFFERANVGAYGYGRTDENPVVLNRKLLASV